MPAPFVAIPGRLTWRAASRIGFGVTLPLLVFGGMWAFRALADLAQKRELVEHTHQVLESLEVLGSTLKDAETGQRGYLVAEDDAYLQPYDEAVRRVGVELNHLKELTRAAPEQQRQLALVEQQVTEKLAELKETVDLARQGDRAGALAVVRSNRGKQLMDDVRDAVSTMQRREQIQLNERIADRVVTHRQLNAAIIANTLLGVGLVSLLYWLTRRHARLQDESLATIAEQKERLRTTLASIGDAVISTDKDGRVTNLNAVAETLTGWSNADALGQPLGTVFQIVNEDTRQPVANPADRALQEGVIVGLANHTVLIARDGTEHAIDDSAAPIRCAEGQIVGCVLIFRDITEQRRAARQLASNESRKSAILNTALDCIITCDEDGLIVDFNPASERTFKFRREDVIGKALSDIVVPASLKDRHHQGMLRYRTTGQSRILGKLLVLTGLRSDGSEFPIEFSVNEVRSEGKPFFTAYLRDITERKKMEDELRANAAELSESSRRKNEFLAMLAHELRNPLAAIRNASQLLPLQGQDPAAIQDTAALLNRQIGQMTRFVDDLLDISRISRGKVELLRSKIELASPVHHAVEAALPMFQQRGTALNVTVPQEPIYLQADPARIAQIVGNLLNNAAKFTPSGGRVDLSISREGRSAVIRVRDNGIGLAPDQLPRIFDLFVQVDHSLERTASGLGIGLTLVKNLVELHEGTVEARSAGLGQGSEFIVQLPIAAEAPAAPQPKPPTPVVASVSRRVLVVDDNRDAAKTLALLLQASGHEPHTAFDGLEAVEAAERLRPEVVLCDIGLPKLNGYEVARRLRSESWGRELQLIALTGWGQSEDRQRSAEAGFDGHLVKPVDLAALTRLLADYVPNSADQPT